MFRNRIIVTLWTRFKEQFCVVERLNLLYIHYFLDNYISNILFYKVSLQIPFCITY